MTYPAGAPRYTVGDFADDAVGVLDAFEMGSGHLVGISMGAGRRLSVSPSTTLTASIPWC